MIKKILGIAAMLTLLSGCVVIDSKYTGRSRMRIRVHQSDYYYVTPLPIPYYGWIYVPYGYNYYRWHRYDYYNRSPYYRQQLPTIKKTITKKQLKSGSTKSTGTRTVTKSKSSKTKVKNK